MLNAVWLGMMVVAVMTAIFNGHLSQVVLSVAQSASFAFKLALGLTGIMALWIGIMRIAEAAGLVQLLAKSLKPLFRRLFSDVPGDHPANAAMMLNIASNMLGLNNAATPFGLKAMGYLNELNPVAGTATNAMCTFLAINTSSVQLIPATAMAMLAAGGASTPSDIILPALFATSCSTIFGIVGAKILERLPSFQIKK